MATRRKHALRKQGLRSPVVLDPSSALPKLMAGQHDVVITAHQRQAKLSNPTANIRLSAKKVKKIKQRARIVQNFVIQVWF